MAIEYKFAQIYAAYKKRKEKNEFRERICKACNYDEKSFWKRKRGEISEITVPEIVVWMQVAQVSFEDLVVYKSQ